MDHYNADKHRQIQKGLIKNTTKEGTPKYHMFFGKRSFNELIEMLVSTPQNAFHGCEVNMTDTAIFKDGKTSKFVKTNKEGFL